MIKMCCSLINMHIFLEMSDSMVKMQASVAGTKYETEVF